MRRNTAQQRQARAHTSLPRMRHDQFHLWSSPLMVACGAMSPMSRPRHLDDLTRFRLLLMSLHVALCCFVTLSLYVALSRFVALSLHVAFSL